MLCLLVKIYEIFYQCLTHENTEMTQIQIPVSKNPQTSHVRIEEDTHSFSLFRPRPHRKKRQDKRIVLDDAWASMAIGSN